MEREVPERALFQFSPFENSESLFQPQADPVVYLDCLSGCPEIEKVKIASIGEPQRHVFCLKNKSASPFLPKVRVLEFVGVDFGEGSEHPLFAEIGRITVSWKSSSCAMWSVFYQPTSGSLSNSRP